MKQIKDMTTAEWRKAWTDIAVAFAIAPNRRNTHQTYVAYDGLCSAWRRHTDVVQSVGSFIRQLQPGDDVGYWFPPITYGGWTREYDLLRATFAAMFAAMTPKEFLEICEAPR